MSLTSLTPRPLAAFLVFVLTARLPTKVLESLPGSGATRFARQHWVVLVVLVVGLSALYLLNQRRTETWLEALTRRSR